MASETFAFQAEINQLLSLIINTFYSNKDIFLRELISNASDAIDKVRYKALTDPDVLKDEKDLEIKIVADKEAKTITIQDNGIGMTREDLIKNLGTIAHSGTRTFIESMQSGNKPDISLIGQFGVGFYSAYLVADNVQVVSKSVDDENQYIWESTASGSFTITKDDGKDDKMVRGTKIILSLKEDYLEYLEESKIVNIIKKHSQFCSFPIKLFVEREEVVKDEDVVITEASNEIQEGEIEEDAEEKHPPKEEKTKTIKVQKWDVLNKQQPIWTRNPENVTEDEYLSFYKTFSGSWEDHLHVKHFAVDGQVQFKALLYVPKTAPFDMFQKKTKADNIKLYVKKVLIMDETNDFLPEYLNFIKGVVDSDDLPLNVSREMLQQNSIMKVIKKNLVKKSIDMMTELTKDSSKWDQFYNAFSGNIKLGVHEDEKNRSKLIDLLRFYSSKSDDKSSFKDYVLRLKEGQTKIYYVTSDNLKTAKSSPFIEKLIKKDIEVLYLVDTIDEYMIQSIKEYDGKELVCCSKDGFEIEVMSEEEKQDKEVLVKEWEQVCEKIKSILTPRVINVKVSDRLASNPCVLVSDKYGWTPNMEKIMKAQALSMANNMPHGMSTRRVLEVNPSHPILKEIKVCIDNKKEIKNIVEMLFDTVILDSGFSLEEPSKYAQTIYKMIMHGLSADHEDEENEAIDNTPKLELNAENSTMEEVD